MTFGRLGIYHHTAAQGFGRGWTAQNVAVTAHRHHGVTQFQLQPARFAGIEGFAPQQTRPGHHLGSADKKFHFGGVRQRTSGIGQETKMQVHPLGGAVLSWQRQHIAALNFIHLNAGEIDRRAAARLGGLLLLAVSLQGADATTPPGWQYLHLIPQAQGAIGKGASDHGAKAGHGKNAVDGQARAPKVGAWGAGMQTVCQRLLQLCQTGAGARRNPANGGLCQNGLTDRLMHIQFHQIQPVRIRRQVSLGQGDDAAGDLQQVENCQVLAGLGHHALIGGNDK